MDQQKPSRNVTRKCLSCQKVFRPRRRDARYCSAACRQKAQRARDEVADIDRQIEAARLLYWDLIYKKARALGRRPTDVLEAQYVDLDGQVWMLAPDGTRRLAGKMQPSRPGWAVWGLEAAGPPWCPPSNGFYESAILGKRDSAAQKTDTVKQVEGRA